MKIKYESLSIHSMFLGTGKVSRGAGMPLHLVNELSASG